MSEWLLAATFALLIAFLAWAAIDAQRCFAQCDAENARRRALPPYDPERLLECICR